MLFLSLKKMSIFYLPTASNCFKWKVFKTVEISCNKLAKLKRNIFKSLFANFLLLTIFKILVGGCSNYIIIPFEEYFVQFGLCVHCAVAVIHVCQCGVI